MKLKYALIILLAFLMGCGGYKQLKPKPAVNAVESAYTPITNNDKNFELKQGKKYYMAFPAVQQSNFYLVLKMREIDQLSTYLTRKFNKGKDEIKMNDESQPNDDENLYTLDQTTPIFTWVIDAVHKDMELDLDYRYMPIWRYQFERKNTEFQTTLVRNTVDRRNYESLGSGTSVASLNYDSELEDIRRKTDNLKAIEGGLLEIETLFPADIKNSDDQAYLDYVSLKEELSGEIQFQDDYNAFLSLVKAEKESRSNTEKFVESIPTFLTFFDGKDRHPGNVVDEAQKLVGSRLSEIAPYYERELRTKTEISPINFPTDDARRLYKECQETPDPGFVSLTKFVDTYNANADAVQTTRQEIDDLMSKIRTEGTWPSNSFYPSIQSQVDQLQAGLPSASTRGYGKYATYSCVEQLNREVASVNREADKLQTGFQTAASIVPQINRMKEQGNYRGIIQTLLANRSLDFLLAQYPDVDQLYFDQQTAGIERALDNQDWVTAESKLRELHENRDYLNYNAFAATKNRLEKQYEERMVSAIEQGSKERIASFMELNKNAIDNVDALYTNPAFDPVHTLTFSAGGLNIVNMFNKQVQDYLDSYKYDQFPKMAIESIYRDFSRNPNDNGVAKARAIIAHGKYYKGDDRKTKNLIAEADPAVAKWITKPKDYRKIFVIPVNETQQSKNSYKFRLNLKIPSDARFPVWDVNIKLPREVANSSGERQWFTKMTMNGKVLKNEGRFTISAPTRSNNYECKITPLQTNKEGNNILEVTFDHVSFKVLEVSVMAQRPIIGKD